MFSKPEEVLEFIKSQDVKFVDVRFCDLPGIMQHFNVPAASLTLDFFTEGQMFDGSSIRGFQAIHESDMKLIPDPKTAYLDPFRKEKTLIMNFSIVDPFTDEPYSRDPRNIAAKAEAYQTNRNLVLTEGAGAESIPNLEILNNDVKWSHASAVGSIDPDQLYYLESRGVPPEEAERLIVLGFFDDVLDRLPLQSLTASLRSAIVEKIEHRRARV